MLTIYIALLGVGLMLLTVILVRKNLVTHDPVSEKQKHIAFIFLSIPIVIGGIALLSRLNH